MNSQDVQQLIAYHYWARDRILDAAEKLSPEDVTRDLGNSFKSVRDTLVHIYSAEWIWCSRWKGSSPAALDSSAFGDIPALRAAWSEHEVTMRSVVAEAARDGLDRMVEYRDLKGNPWRETFWKMVQHVVNHASYHRGQVTTMLRQLKAAPPASMDLIAFYRAGLQPATKTPDLGAVFDAHVTHEFVHHDVDATMGTMVDEPYVHNVPTLTGGVGRAAVETFYRQHFVGKMPADTKVVSVSRTVGAHQVVEEAILSFTHDIVLDFMLPGVPPTGKHIEIPHVVVMKFEGDKIAHEHIYWDQASVLVQAGVLDVKTVPVVGAEQATRLLELTERSRIAT